MDKCPVTYWKLPDIKAINDGEKDAASCCSGKSSNVGALCVTFSFLSIKFWQAKMSADFY